MRPAAPLPKRRATTSSSLMKLDNSLEAAAQPVYDQWIADMKAKGIDGKELIARAKGTDCEAVKLALN